MSHAGLSESDAPFQGLRDKIDVIKGYYISSLRYPSIRSLAEVGSMTKLGKPSVSALFAFLRGHTRYISDPVGAELIKAPWVMAAEMARQGWSGGDCDDLASLAYTCLQLIGKPAALAVGWYDGNVNPSHIFAIAQDTTPATVFDLCAPSLGVTKTGVSKFEVYG